MTVFASYLGLFLLFYYKSFEELVKLLVSLLHGKLRLYKLCLTHLMILPLGITDFKNTTGTVWEHVIVFLFATQGTMTSGRRLALLS